jgi:lysophospholipase L1-like esterase
MLAGVSLVARSAGIGLASLVAFLTVVLIQLRRVRRLVLLPGHPGFYVNRTVYPSRGGAGSSGVRALRLLVFGDSTTAGVGVDRPEDALPSLIAGHLADASGRPVHVTSYGWAGARVADVVSQQVPRAQEPLRDGETQRVLPTADVVAIVVGSNDTLRRTRPWRFRAALRTVLDEVHATAPHAEVVVAGIPIFRGVLPQIEPLIRLSDQWGRLLRRVQRQEARRAGVAFADLAADAHPRMRGRREVVASDLFHPSAVGYAVWADVIASALLHRPAGSRGRAFPSAPLSGEPTSA